jgi:hypothetical protein
MWNDDARQIYERLHSEKRFTLAKARSDYKDIFGMSHDDQAIDEEYRHLFDDHLDSDDGLVPLPLWLTLALYLREGMGRSRGPLAKGPDADEVLALLMARGMAAEYRREQNCTAGAAYNKAARAITTMGYQVLCLENEILYEEWCPYTTLSEEQIIERLQHPSRYGFKKYFDNDAFNMPWSGELPT